MQPRFNLLALGSCWVRGALRWVQNVKVPHSGYYPTRSPNTSGFTLQWIIGYKVVCKAIYDNRTPLKMMVMGFGDLLQRSNLP